MQPEGHLPASAVALATVHSHAEVVGAVKTFLEGLPAEQIARLPAACRAMRIRDAEDVAELAYAVARARLELPFEGNTLSLVDEFLARACGRLAWLDAYGQPNQPGMRPSAQRSRL